jgi:hypothetical protein
VPITLNAVRQEFIEAVAITRNEEDTVNDDHKILQVSTDLARTEDLLSGIPPSWRRDVQ